MTDLLEPTTESRPAQPARPPVHPRIARRWVDNRRQEGRRRLRLVVAASSVVIVLAASFAALHSPLFALRHVRDTVQPAVPGSAPGPGQPDLTPAAIARWAGLASRPPMIDIDTAAAARRLDAIPYLAEARVAARWPSTVTVSLEVRSPLAAVATSGGFAVLDRTGRVLTDVSTLPLGMPVVSVAGPVPAPGGWLAGSAGPAADPARPAAGIDTAAHSDAPDVPSGPAAALAVMDSLPGPLRADVTAVDASGTDLTVVVAPPRLASGTITVDLGDGSLLAAKVTALMTVVDTADLSGVARLDLTVPSRPSASAVAAQPGTQAAGKGPTP